MQGAEAALFIGKASFEKRDDLFPGELFEHVHPAARKQRRNDFERWILGCCTDQSDAALFNMGKKGVLLRLVETMNFVDKDDRAGAVLTCAVGVRHDLLDFLDPGKHRREFDELGLSNTCDDLRQGCFTGARRTPENHRARIITLDLNAQRFARANEMLLADKFFESPRTHAVGERTRAIALAVSIRNGLEEAHAGIILCRGAEPVAKSRLKAGLNLLLHP